MKEKTSSLENRAPLKQDEIPLDQEDIHILGRLIPDWKSPSTLFVLLIILIIAATPFFFTYFTFLLLDRPRTAGAGAFFLFVDAATFGLLYYIGRNLSFLPRSLARIRAGLSGKAGKSIVKGYLLGAEPGDAAGTAYVFAHDSVNVREPSWNSINPNKRYGKSPKSAEVLSGEVTLHLFEFLPDRPPLLLKAIHENSPESSVHMEELTDEDADSAGRRKQIGMVAFVTIAALCAFVALSLGALGIAAAVIVVSIAYGVIYKYTQAKATGKKIIEGIVDEVFVYPITRPGGGGPGSTVPDQRYACRIGGQLYTIPTSEVPIAPGQHMRLETVIWPKTSRVLAYQIEKGQRVTI